MKDTFCNLFLRVAIFFFQKYNFVIFPCFNKCQDLSHLMTCRIEILDVRNILITNCRGNFFRKAEKDF